MYRGQSHKIWLIIVAVLFLFTSAAQAEFSVKGYDAKKVLQEVSAYQSHAIKKSSQTWKIVGELVSSQKIVAKQGVQKYSAINVKKLKANEVYGVLMSHFEKIGKAEHVKRALHAYRLSSAPENKKDALKSVLQMQTGFVSYLYRSPKLASLLTQAAKYKKHSEIQKRNLQAMLVDHAKETAVSDELNSEITHMRIQGRVNQKDYKKQNDSKKALAWLEKVFANQRKVGSVIAKKLSLKTPYDGVLAQFQSGYGVDKLDSFYAELIPAVKKIAGKAIKKQAGKEKPQLPEGPYPLPLQAKFNKITSQIFKQDSSRFHIAFSELHSVEGGIVGDVRLVVSLGKSRLGSFVKANRSTFHELGHGLHIDGIPSETMFTPIGKLMGTAVEEAFAFLVEKMITRSKPYADYISPIASKIFKKKINSLDYFRSRTWVQNSLIRIAADEVTYPVHPYIRMKIERDIINGKMSVKDIPRVWNKMYKDLLGVAPPTASKGFIQDVHWYVAKVGMFPFYTLGDAIAAQLMSKIRKDIPDLDVKIAAGDLSSLRLWLNKNVFSKGRFTGVDEFCLATTGEKLKAKYLISHLNERYTK